MGASNFYTKNADKLYPLFTDIPDEEKDFFDYEEETANIADYIQGLVKDYDIEVINERKGYDRSYPERILNELTVSKMFGDVEIEVKLEVIIRAGYYEGANLDYYVTFQDQNCYDGLEDADEIAIDNYNSDMNAGLCKIQTKNAINWATSQAEELENYIETIFTKITEPYVLVARASNGETFYKKVV